VGGVIAHDVYAHALDGGAPALICRDAGGRTRALAVDRWLGTAAPADEHVLDRAEGPVLDVGCGPGRHVGALARRGVLALGVDVSPEAVRLARGRGAAVHEGSIFDRVPGAGTWRSALLLDGNVGIGGRPATLLRRIADLLAPGARVLVELEPPGRGERRERLRLETGAAVSGWFSWARVAVDAVDGPAGAAGLAVADRWCDDGRWFAALRRA
jgi:SAM-dependent methyltransferase